MLVIPALGRKDSSQPKPSQVAPSQHKTSENKVDSHWGAQHTFPHTCIHRNTYPNCVPRLKQLRGPAKAVTGCLLPARLAVSLSPP